MAKLTGRKKQQFLARMNKGRKAAGLKSIGSKIKTKLRSKSKGSSLSRSKRSGSTVARRQFLKSRGRRSSGGKIKPILKKAGIGLGIGMAIRLATMFINDNKIRELGNRGAAAGAAVGGLPGEIAYQAADAAVSRLILTVGQNGNSNGVTIPNPLAGGA